MKTLGVDVGSRYVKLAAFDGEELLFADKLDTITFYTLCRHAGKVDISRLPVFREKGFAQGRVASTGYGRYNVRIEGSAVISEIKAHAIGAAHQSGLADFTLLDLGGQDTKVVRVRGGEVDDFVMNDKCAAGSGRYLENIAAILGITPEELARHTEKPLSLSATCAIFGESEVVGAIAEGAEIAHICAGANLSVAQRLIPLARRYGSEKYVVTGGVALNGGVLKFLGEKLGAELIVPRHPIFNGAIGCALEAATVNA